MQQFPFPASREKGRHMGATNFRVDSEGAKRPKIVAKFRGSLEAEKVSKN